MKSDARIIPSVWGPRGWHGRPIVGSKSGQIRTSQPDQVGLGPGVVHILDSSCGFCVFSGNRSASSSQCRKLIIFIIL